MALVTLTAILRPTLEAADAIEQTGQLLGIGERTLYRKRKEYGLR